jgi:hypothetical protein
MNFGQYRRGSQVAWDASCTKWCLFKRVTGS